jgi:hypothetical protein
MTSPTRSTARVHLGRVQSDDLLVDAVGREIVRLLELPFGTRPPRAFVDYQDLHLDRITDVQREVLTEILGRIGMEQMLTVKTPEQPEA